VPNGDVRLGPDGHKASDDTQLKRLLLVTHRSIDQAGGPAARWRSLARHLPDLGWELEVLSAAQRASAVEFSTRPEDQRRAAVRARVMGTVGRVSSPAFAVLGIRPEAVPLSMTWIPRARSDVRERVRAQRPDIVLATGPPMAAVIGAALATGPGSPPLVVELRDLWAGNPAFDRRGGLLGRLERWVLGRAAAVIAPTPECVADLRARHPARAASIHGITNGYEPFLLERREVRPMGSPIEILHSGSLTVDRPLRPLLTALARDPSRFRLVLHGFVAPAILREIADFGDRVDVELVPPSSWEDAVARMATTDVTLVTQARSAGDETAVAAKVYEYLALGRPVLATTDGGGTEALLRRLGVDGLAARLDDPESIERALARLAAGEVPAPVPPELLRPYDRRVLAAEMAALLDSLVEK
jgi:glycosyltransferase involved in cell wall biosynthesis